MHKEVFSIARASLKKVNFTEKEVEAAQQRAEKLKLQKIEQNLEVLKDKARNAELDKLIDVNTGQTPEAKEYQKNLEMYLDKIRK